MPVCTCGQLFHKQNWGVGMGETTISEFFILCASHHANVEDQGFLAAMEVEVWRRQEPFIPWTFLVEDIWHIVELKLVLGIWVRMHQP